MADFWLEPLALYQTHDSQSTSSWSVTTAATTDNIFFLSFFKFFVFVFFTFFFFMINRSCDLNTEKTTDDKADLSTASHHVVNEGFFIFMMWHEKEVQYILTEIWNQEMFSFQLPKFEWPTILRLHWWKEQLSNSSHRLGHTARNHFLPPMCKRNRAAEPVFAMNNSWSQSILTLTWHDHSKPWLDITKWNFLKTWPCQKCWKEKENFQNTAINPTK